MTPQLIEQQQTKKATKGVSGFILKGALLFIAWQLLYNFVLQPWGVLDKALTEIVVAGTVQMLSFFSADVFRIDNSVFLNGKQSINIADACNGLELIALYLGYFILLPSGWKKMLLYIVSGILMIAFLNITRCALLAHLYLHDISTAEIAHKYVFKLAVYAFVFIAWMLYSKNLKQKNAES